MALVKEFVHCRNKKPLEINGSVAIVGNSDLLANSEYGQEIDSHDNVFRFNLASTEEKFHASTGAKADFYVMSQNITNLQYPHPEPLQSRFKEICRKSTVICYPGHEKNVIKIQKRPYLLTHSVDDVNRLIIQVCGRPVVTFPPNNHPRNGIKLLMPLLAAGIKPTLYGFDTEQRPEASHYFDDEIQIDVGPKAALGHRLSLEYILLSSLIRNDLVTARN